MTNPDNVGGLRYTDHNVMNGALCDFATRWRIDGDYIRCGTCDRRQLTSYADNDFPHADFCRVKDSPNMERRPWQAYVALLSPLAALDSAPAGSGEVEEVLKKCDSVLNDMRPISPCLTEQMEEYFAEIRALLRKLQQGAE